MSATVLPRRPSDGVRAQILRFALVGVTNTALTLSCYTALTAAGLRAPLASAVGWGAGAANGYLLNRGWTFRSTLRGSTPAARYVAVQGAAAAVNALAIIALTMRHLPHLDAEVAILPAVTMLSFTVCRRWVFT